MAALSDYLESGILTHIFLSGVFAKPSNISVALTSGVPVDSDTGATIPELPSGINGISTGYNRVSLGDPNAGTYWNSIGTDDSSKFKVFGCTSDDDLVYNYSVNIDGYNFTEPRFYFSRLWPDRQSKIEDQKRILNFKQRGSHDIYPFLKITDEQWGFELLPTS